MSGWLTRFTDAFSYDRKVDTVTLACLAIIQALLGIGADDSAFMTGLRVVVVAGLAYGAWWSWRRWQRLGRWSTDDGLPPR